jgi:hypothetical protein
MSNRAVTKTIIVAILAVAVFAGVIYFASDSGDRVPEMAQLPDKAVPAEKAPPAAAAPVPVSRSDAPSRPRPADPRLAALMVSPPDALIEFVPGENGKVIREIDNDPNSASFRKPLRDYTYAGERIAGLVSYKYLGDQVQIVRASVSYKPDGSVDQYRESTSYDKKRN